MQTTVVYLIHFDAPYKHARHYIGSAVDLKKRLMAVVHAAWISWRCVRVRRGGRAMEWKIKRIGSGVKVCPVCRPTNRCATFAPALPAPDA